LINGLVLVAGAPGPLAVGRGVAQSGLGLACGAHAVGRKCSRWIARTSGPAANLTIRREGGIFEFPRAWRALR